LHYLGSTEYSFNLNFSRPAAPVIAQMFTFLNLGVEGYTNIIKNDLYNARILSRALEASSYFTILSEIHLPFKDTGNLVSRALDSVSSDEEDPIYYKRGLPVVSFRFTDKFQAEYPHVKQEWMQTLLRVKQWIVPNYALPPNAEKTDILRVVVRESVSIELIHKLVADIVEATESLMKSGNEAIMLSTISAKEAAPVDERVQQTYSKPC